MLERWTRNLLLFIIEYWRLSEQKTPGNCYIKTGEIWCCQSKMCYISIDKHAYMFKHLYYLRFLFRVLIFSRLLSIRVHSGTSVFQSEYILVRAISIKYIVRVKIKPMPTAQFTNYQELIDFIENLEKETVTDILHKKLITKSTLVCIKMASIMIGDQG